MNGTDRGHLTIGRTQGVLLSIAGSLLIVALMVQSGCRQKDDAKSATNGSEKAIVNSNVDDSKRNRNMDVQLNVTGRIDGDRMRVVLSVKNGGTEALQWDKEFAALMTWNISVDDEEMVDVISREILENKEIDVGRFVDLPPGESITKEFDLNDKIAVFWSARKTVTTPDGGSETISVGGEELVRFKIPKHFRELRIKVVYDGVDDDMADAFAVFYGFRPESRSVPQVRLESKAVITGRP